MTAKDDSLGRNAELRQRAEAMARQKAAHWPEDLEVLSPMETKRMLHELRVHQLELEMQNEELRRAQMELDIVRARYFDLYDLAPVGYCTLSEQGLILEANLAAAGLLGVVRGALASQPISRFIVKEDQDSYYLHRKQLVETGERQAWELRMVKFGDKAGTLVDTPFWVHLTVTIGQDSEGAPIYRIVLSDITRRKHAEMELLRLNEELEVRIQARTADLRAALDTVNLEIQERKKATAALRQSEEKYSTVVENSPTGIFILRDQEIPFANRRFFEIVRRAPEELATIRPSEILHPEDWPAINEVWKNCLANLSAPKDIECRILAQGGGVRWIIGRTTVIPFQNGLALLVNIQDITERHDAVQALRDSQEALHGLSARLISIQENERYRVARDLHDSIGSTLTAIKIMVEGSLEAARQEGTDGRMTALRSVIPVIQNAIEEVRRISMALRPLTLDDLGLTVTIDWFLREFQTAHPKVKVGKRIELTEEEIPDPLKINIFRILQEGLNNSAKYSQASRMDVSLRREEEQIVLELEDDGVGFDPAVLRPPDSTGGFGLASMRERTKLSGGELSVLAAPGKGVRIRAQWSMASPTAS